MDSRTKIPALALLGLSFTGCPGGDDEPNPIVGEWGAIQFDGMKLPTVETYDGVGPIVSGIAMTVEDDLAGELAFYSDVDYGDYQSHYSYGTDLVVDDSEAPKYRVELARDMFGVGEPPYYDTSGGTAVTSDGYDTGYVGDGDDGLVQPLSAPIRPAPAPAELVLTCTLDQDVLSCESDADEATRIVFKRKPKQDED